MKLLLATSNPGKLVEVREILAPLGLDDHPRRRNHIARDADLARVGRQKSGEHAQSRGLAAARRSQQADELTAFGCEVDRVDRRQRAVAFGEAAKLEVRHVGRRGSARAADWPATAIVREVVDRMVLGLVVYGAMLRVNSRLRNEGLTRSTSPSQDQLETRSASGLSFGARNLLSRIACRCEFIRTGCSF